MFFLKLSDLCYAFTIYSFIFQHEQIMRQNLSEQLIKEVQHEQDNLDKESFRSQVPHFTDQLYRGETQYFLNSTPDIQHQH